DARERRHRRVRRHRARGAARPAAGGLHDAGRQEGARDTPARRAGDRGRGDGGALPGARSAAARGAPAATPARCPQARGAGGAERVVRPAHGAGRAPRALRGPTARRAWAPARTGATGRGSESSRDHATFVRDRSAPVKPAIEGAKVGVPLARVPKWTLAARRKSWILLSSANLEFALHPVVSGRTKRWPRGGRDCESS